MSLFGPYSLDAMNETDVREMIVRPLLHELGYRQGTNANIRTEIRLSYSKAFLGHKNPKKDLILAGRADYICEVVSFGRWVVEVKAPNHDLALEDAQQAHTYAAHPEVGAMFSLLTNGREFRVYRTSWPQEPIFSWKTEETEELLPNIINLLGPEAIKQRVHVPVDLGKPLAIGFGATIKLAAGSLLYERHTTDQPMFQNAFKSMDGIRASVTGKTAYRLQDGRIQGELEMAGPYSFFDQFNEAAGLRPLDFSTSDEYVSTDVEKPTIFQNVASASVPSGFEIPALIDMPSGFQLPFGLTVTAFTEAVGYIKDSRLVGTFEISYDLQFVNLPPQATARLPSRISILGEGSFDIIIQ